MGEKAKARILGESRGRVYPFPGAGVMPQENLVLTVVDCNPLLPVTTSLRTGRGLPVGIWVIENAQFTCEGSMSVAGFAATQLPTGLLFASKRAAVIVGTTFGGLALPNAVIEVPSRLHWPTPVVPGLKT